MGMAFQVPLVLFIDSTAAIDHSKNVGTSKRTFHLERWEYFFRECAQRQWVKPHWVGTKFQMAETSLVCQVINFYESQPETSAVMETGFTYKEKFITFADIFKVEFIN